MWLARFKEAGGTYSKCCCAPPAQDKTQLESILAVLRSDLELATLVPQGGAGQRQADLLRAEGPPTATLSELRSEVLRLQVRHGLD
jgi:hypothetical protein